MKTFIFFATCATFCGGLLAQTAASTAARSDSPNAEHRVSNEDMNIRAYIQLLRSDVKKSAAQVMGEVMQLDTDQSQKFWPIYKEYETERAKIGDQIVGALKTYSETYDRMTDSTADNLANQVLGIENQRTVLKKKYYERMKKSLGAITAARFLQVENQLERLMDLQLSAQLPVISQ